MTSALSLPSLDLHTHLSLNFPSLSHSAARLVPSIVSSRPLFQSIQYDLPYPSGSSSDYGIFSTTDRELVLSLLEDPLTILAVGIGMEESMVEVRSAS